MARREYQLRLRRGQYSAVQWTVQYNVRERVISRNRSRGVSAENAGRQYSAVEYEREAPSQGKDRGSTS